MTTANSRAAKRPPSKDTVVMRPMPCREELGVGVSVVIGLPKSDIGIGNYLREEVTFNSKDAWFMGIRARAKDLMLLCCKSFMQPGSLFSFLRNDTLARGARWLELRSASALDEPHAASFPG
jgi:hypothetical protein